jgi:cytochrome c biogenesis protein CcmG, thiol:disulfide interchange protein DsbE
VKLVAQVLAVTLVAALIALFGWRVFHHPAPPKAGKAAPDFALARLDRPGTLSLASLRGHGVLINFWESSCVPCASESPFLEHVAHENKARGLVVLGVDPGDLTSDAKHFLAKHHITYPTVHDTRYSVAGSYAITGTPESFFVDRKGRLVDVHIIGPVDSAANRPLLAQGIRAALES